MNNKNTFETLFNQSRSRLYAIAYSVSHNKESAEDILQDAYVKAWRKFNKYDSNKKFENWMTTIIKNVAIDNNRHKSNKINTIPIEQYRLGGPSMSWDIEDSKADMFENYSKKVTLNQIYSAMQNLPDGLGSIMVLYAEGYTHSDIASELGISLSSVKSKVNRAKQILRKNVKTL